MCMNACMCVDCMQENGFISLITGRPRIILKTFLKEQIVMWNNLMTEKKHSAAFKFKSSTFNCRNITLFM